MSFSELDLCLRYPYRQTPGVLVDVGGHVGSFSRPFAERGWQVLAFEPEATNREKYLRNLAPFDRVTCLPLAVSNVDGETVPFFVSDTHYGIHSLRPFHASHTIEQQVLTTTLKAALETQGLDRITLLKIDTEGADFLALQGLDFARHRPELIMLEFMDERSQANFGYRHDDVVRFMTDQGYVGFVSSWAPIQEYGREGVAGEAHRWLRCAPYPLSSPPAWGNLLFVPAADAGRFTAALAGYLDSLRPRGMARVRQLVKRVPGAEALYRRLRDR